MADIKQTAQEYIDAGWAVVPLAPNAKRGPKSWNSKTFTPADFQANSNIAGKCGEPSGWRVDVDCDDPTAVEAARLLLPPTGLVHGRPGKCDSHYWFICSGAKTTQFTDVKDSSGQSRMLVEVRSSGGYTALPPSVHPSGETLVWTIERSPAVITPDDLYHAVRNVAVASLLALHWPGPGARHHMVGHLAGFLLQAKVPDFLVVEIIRTAATIAGDPDVHDRVTFAQSTCGKLAAGNPVTGGPKLEECLGEAVVKKLRQWLRLPDADVTDITPLLEEMNERHFFTTMGNKAIVGSFVRDREGQIPFVKATELKQQYANRRVVVADLLGRRKDTSLFEAWLEWPGRRDFDQVVFAPPPLEAGSTRHFNLWVDFAVEPVAPTPISPAEAHAFAQGAYVPGRCFRVLHHLRHIIANDDPLYHDALLNCLARMIQHPGEVAGSAHVWCGEEGTGKNIVIDYVCQLFHKSMVFSGASDLIVGRFNACTRNRVFININESDGRKLKKNFDKVKMIITEGRAYLELKGVDAYPIDNFAHVIFTTNGDEDGNVDLPAHAGQRRLVFQSINNRYATGRCSAAERKTYFDALIAELRDKRSLGSFLWLLQHRDLSDYDPYAKLVTDEEVRQRALAMISPLRWLWDLVALGKMPVLTLNDAEVNVTMVYGHYVEWAKQRGEKPSAAGPWGKAVNPYIWESTRRTKTDRLGVLVSIEELERRLRATSDPDREFAELVWNYPRDGSRTTNYDDV